MSFPFALMIVGFGGSGRKAAVNHALKQLAIYVLSYGKGPIHLGER